jgi:hypothetical protein
MNFEDQQSRRQHGKRRPIEEYVEQMTPENLHEAIDTGKPIGKETL